jgi:hypothetical protein
LQQRSEQSPKLAPADDVEEEELWVLSLREIRCPKFRASSTTLLIDISEHLSTHVPGNPSTKLSSAEMHAEWQSFVRVPRGP